MLKKRKVSGVIAAAVVGVGEGLGLGLGLVPGNGV